MTAPNAQLIRKQVWEVVYTANLNVHYWPAIIELKRRRVLWAKRGVAGVAAIFTICLIFVPNATLGVVLTALLGLLSVLATTFVEKNAPVEDQWARRRWSELHSDATRVWQSGESCKWDERISDEAGRVIEREKQYQAHEDHLRNEQLANDCQDLVDRELT